LPARVPTVLLVVLICICFGTIFACGQQDSKLPGTISSPAPSVILKKVTVSASSNGLVIEIATSAPLIPTSDRLANPDRLVFDFPGCELQATNRHIPVNTGPVRELRLSQFSLHPPVSRVVVDSNLPLDFEMKPSGNKVVIEITFPKSPSHPATPAIRSSPAKQESAADAGAGNPPTQKIVSSEVPKPSAYSLQAKAKALNVEDLQGLEDMAAAGNPEAQTTLALAYHAGVLLKQNDAEALRLLHKAADHDFMAAEESLGILAETGIGTQQPSPSEAIEWYKKAVRQGSLDAATNIGLMYAQGRGVPRDAVEALNWLRQAAEGGDATAQYNLALLYARGDGIPKNEKESVRWLTAAADQNVIPALLDLANFYMHPPASTTEDVSRAIPYYKKAAELGSARAQAILGTIFAKGMQGVPDYEQSVNWYRNAADQGERDGQCGLAMRYALGQGVPIDLEEARRLFTAAANQGQPEAEYDLAVMCEEGKGGPADRSLAEHYYQMAAERGAPKAQFRLGMLLASGESRTDKVSAYRWLMLSQDSMKESSAALNSLRKSMNDQEIAEAERQVDTWRLAHLAKRP
jgi:TPR repeat protein